MQFHLHYNDFRFSFAQNLQLESKLKDIKNIEDIQQFVNEFYGKVQKDELIGPIFNERIEGRWPAHLAKMYTFWETILLGNQTYFGSPFPPHANLPVEKKHFDRWLEIFHSTINHLFEGEIAEEAKWRAGKMAQMFQFKINHIQTNPGKSLV